MDGAKRDLLVDRAQRAPSFFHSLVFSPATVVEQVAFLDAEEKAALARLRPEGVIDVLTGAAPLTCRATEG